MPYTALTTITRTSPLGTDVTSVDVAADTVNGNSVTWTPDMAVYVLNGDDASITVTAPTPNTVGGRAALAVGDIAVVIPAGAWRIIGPFPRECRQEDGTVHLDFTGTTMTGVMVAPLRVY